MNALQWSDQKPKQPGWYWLDTGEREPQIVKVDRMGAQLRILYKTPSGYCEINGFPDAARWAGPIGTPVTKAGILVNG